MTACRTHSWTVDTTSSYRIAGRYYTVEVCRRCGTSVPGDPMPDTTTPEEPAR